MLFYVVSFILLLGPLVFVHEFGHFLFAKIFGVRVDVFSMGFGPRILSKKWGETEYCISVVPLGGYVKLYGQDPTETIDPKLKNRALSNLEAWKRFLVFFAGPLFNFLFAIFVFALVLVVGEPHVSPVVARVTPQTEAYKAGFRSGDLVTSINRQVVTRLEEVTQIINDSPRKELNFRVKRAGEFKEIAITPHIERGLSMYGEPMDVGDIDGFSAIGRYMVVGVSNPKSGAGKVKLKTGDEIVTFNGTIVKSFEELEDLVSETLTRQKGVREFVFGIVPHDAAYWTPEHKPVPATKPTTFVKLPAKPLKDFGLYSSELFVLSVIKNSPAEKAGVLSGDRLVAVDGKRLSSFVELREEVQRSGETKGMFTLSVERDGKTLNREVIPLSTEGSDAAGRSIQQYMMGVFPLFVQSEPPMYLERIFNPFTLTVEAWQRALDLSGKTFVSIKKLLARQVSVGTLGGPILIGKLAGDSMERGIAHFLKVMALISVSLSVFNILPVPILDGGHIMLLLVEVIRGRPISLRQSEVVQQIGLTLIVFLLVVVLFNDFSKVGLPALRQIFQ